MYPFKMYNSDTFCILRVVQSWRQFYFRTFLLPLKESWYPLRVSEMMLVINPCVNAGDIRDMGSISGLGWSPGEGMATHSSILFTYYF